MLQSERDQLLALLLAQQLLPMARQQLLKEVTQVGSQRRGNKEQVMIV